MKNCKTSSERGFTLIELMIVLIIIGIMGGITGYYLTSHQKLYKPDDQALQLVDMMQQARQYSLTKRETMRVEIDLSDNVARLYDENEPDTQDDDEVVRQITLLPQTEIKLDQRPVNVTVNPPETLAVTSAVFAPSTYPPSATHRIFTLRFESDYQAVDQNGVPRGTVLHIWSPSKSNANNADIARAITVIGTTGSIRLWEWQTNSTDANKWKDSRRVGG